MEGIAETFERVAKFKKKQEKINELRQAYSPSMGAVLDLCFNPKYVWLIPESDPPYKPQPKEADNQGVLIGSVRKFGVFLQNNGYDEMKQWRREQLFIQYLEQMDPDDAKLMLSIRKGRLPQKGLTKALIAEAFPVLGSKWEVKEKVNG